MADFNEDAFQAWYAQVAAARGLITDADDPGHHYDYRAYYQSLDEAGRAAAIAAPEDTDFPSAFKADDHPDRFSFEVPGHEGVLWDTKLDQAGINPISSGTTETLAVSQLLGFTPEDYFLIIRSLDPDAVRRFWDDAYQTLRDQTDPQDTPEKRINFSKGMAWLQALKAGATQRRNLDPSNKFATAAATVADTATRLEESIRSNTLIRVGVLSFDERTIQPTDIGLSETYDNEKITTLRSETEVSRRKPQSMTQITLDFTFAGAGMINNLMRPLIAQLRAIPCLTIESAFLTNALINHYATPEIEAQIVDRVSGAASEDFRAQLDKLSEEATQTFDSVRSILKTDDLALEYMRKRVLQRRAELGDSSGSKEKITGDSLPIPASMSTADSLLDFGIAIPVVVNGLVVTTDPASPNTLHLRASFLRYSPSVFGPRGLEFRDKNGAPTMDIGQCPWIRRYFEWAYMNSSVNPDYYLAPYNPPLTSHPDFECTWDDILDRRPEYRRQFPSVDAPADFVIESVEAALNFAIAPIPILGSKYPTVHVMGQSGVTAKISLATTNPKVVRAFHLMKDHVDALARNVGGLFRDEAISIKNAVLNTLGGKDFIITSVATEPYPETSNGYRITATLAQSRYARGSQFRFDLVQGGIPEDLLRSFWDYLYTLYQQYRAQALNGTITDQKIVRMINLVFGSTTQRGAATVNTSVLLAGMAYLFHQGNPEWFLDSGITEMYNVLKKQPDRITQEFFQIDETNAEANARVDAATKKHYATLEGLNPAGSDLAWSPPEIYERGKIEGDALAVRGGIRAQIAHEAIQGAVVTALNDGHEQPIYDSVISYLARPPWANFINISKPLWDAMLEVLMKANQPPRCANKQNRLWEQKLTDAAILGLAHVFQSGAIDSFGEFPGLDKYLKADDRLLQVKGTRKLFESNYPDLVLPTYAEIFGNDTAKLRNGETRPLWEVFAPTYSQLGATPPYSSTTFTDLEDSLHQTAKKPEDTVEPGFFYWAGTVKRQMVDAIKKTIETRDQSYSLAPGDNVSVEALKNADKAAGRKKAVLQVSINTEDRKFNDLPNAKQVETLWRHIKIEARQNRLAEKIITGKADKKVYEVISSDGALLGLVVPDKNQVRGNGFKIRAVAGGKLEVGNPFLRGGVFDRHSEDHNIALLQNSVANLKDNMQSPVRHYPAFRVLFVEWDNNAGRNEPARGAMASKVNLIDDLYTTNSILSIHVTSSKNEAPVAVLRVLNTSGEFDKDVFIEEAEARADGLPVDDEHEDYLKRMKLQSGTGIMIKMGYTSNPNDLDTVFTGQITEVEPGPILTVTAQGYKTELFQQVSLFHPNGNAPTALHKVLNEFPLPHLGRKFDVRDLSPEEQRKITGGSVDDNTPGLTNAFRNMFGGAVTTAARNIYFESSYDIHTTAGEIFKDIGESLNLAADKYWMFDRVTQWDAVWNICRHYPGLIADVRPYDTEATLFMGYPEQPYQFRRPTPREAIEYQKVLRVVVPKNLQTVADDLLKQFWTSDYGTDKPRTDMALATLTSYIESAGRFSDRRDESTAARAVHLAFSSAFEKWYPSFTVTERAPGEIAKMEFNGTQPIGKNLANAVVAQATGVHNFQGDWDSLRNFHSELPTLLACYFFGLDYNHDLVKSSISAAITRDFRRMMGPLYQDFTGSKYGGWFGIVRLTPETEYLRWVGAPGLGGMLYSLPQDPAEYYTDAGKLLEEYGSEEGNAIGTPWKELKRGFAADVPDLAKPRVKHADDGKPFGRIIYENFHRFRLFVHYFGLFIQNQEFAKPKRDLVRDALDKMARSKLPPGYKSFRDYHVVMANRDIIENKIVATTREMANTVMVRAPNKNLKTDDIADAEGGNEVTVISHDQGWVYFPDRHGVPFSPRIPSGQRKLYIAVEPNANMPWSQANCLVTNMAEAIRPMYRGWIKIVGRHVQPWDIITINDGYTQMFGPIEADLVTHEFTRETGWITTIEPHAVVSCNSVSAKYLTSAWQDLTMWFLDDGLDWIQWIAAGATVAASFGAALPAVAGMFAARKFVSNVATKGVKRALFRATKAAALMMARRGRKANIAALLGTVGRAAFRIGMIQLVQGTVAPVASAMFNLNMKMETASGYWPVDLQPLVYKGDPFTAGLEPAEDDIFSFGDQLGGLWKSLKQTVTDGFTAASRDALPGEGPVPSTGTPGG